MIAIFLISLSFLSYFFIGIYRKYAIKQDLLDHPNHRSSHFTPTPVGGGIVFALLWAIGLVFLYGLGFKEIQYLFMFLPAVFLVALVGFLDDRYQLRARLRFLAQLAATIYVLAIVGRFYSLDLGFTILHWGLLGYVFTALTLLWSINLYNFMDGIDALAAIEALFVFGFGGYFVWCAGGVEFAYTIWAVAFIVAGFLLWNKPPAKIFMGDSGSTTLGFLVALFAIIGEKKYHVPALLWVILYGVFWFDSTVTLIRRILHGDKFYQPHKLFTFHRLQLHNWSHRKFIFGAVCVNTGLASFAMLAFYFSQYMLWCLLAVVFVLILIYWLIERIQPMYSINQNKNRKCL